MRIPARVCYSVITEVKSTLELKRRFISSRISREENIYTLPQNIRGMMMMYVGRGTETWVGGAGHRI